MLEFLIYDLKVAVLLAVFYMFYRLLLARETFHRVNRFVLLLTALASFVLPLCVITMHETLTMPMPQIDVELGSAIVVEDASSDTATPIWQLILPILFIIGMVATLSYTLWSLFRILRIIKQSEKHPQADGITICVTNQAEMAPFSWLHYIVMNRSDYETKDAAILTHERGHIRFHHSWDLLLVDTLTALQWFNPAIWMLRSDLRAIHEYEADGAVLSQGINARQYQYLLITKAASIGGYSLANGISHSTLKNRINMMLHTKSPRQRYLKLLAFLPIVAVALAVNAEKVTDVVYTHAEATSMEQMLAEAVSETTQPEAVVADDNEKFIAKGIVYDYSEDKPTPIVGAIVQVSGTKRGTVTDKEGRFKIEVSKGEKLEVAYVGYESTFLGVSKAFSDEGREYIVGLMKEGSDPNKAFDVVEEMPQFPGGAQALMEYLAQNIKYPAEAEKAGIQGRVILTFVVDQDGRAIEPKVVRSVDPLLDAEALRLISTMPKWVPGKQNGEVVRVKYTLPIQFALGGTNVDQTSKVESTNSHGEIVVVGLGPAERPLCIVDGKEITYDEMKALDPQTIDHIEVLKDQDAKEKYGEKAKNGVVLITTKKK